jgi:hypothetical protein
MALVGCGGAASHAPAGMQTPPDDNGGSGGGGSGGNTNPPPSTGGKQDASPPATNDTPDSGPTGGAGGSSEPPAGDDAGTPPAPGDAGLAMPPPPSTDDELPACKNTVNVMDSGALATAITSAKAGDCIVLGDGNYTIPAITKQGTADAPIVIKAANIMKATVNTRALKISGSAYVVVQGLMYTSGTAVSISDCDHCRVTRNRFQLMDGGFDTLTVSGTSKYTRVDHNDFGPKTVLGNTIMLAGAGPQIVQFTRVDHNYFHDVKGGGGNGWETIRAGLSGWAWSSSHTVIEYNLFERCTGDPETISIKSSDNTLRFNTMRNNVGEMVLRHGNRQIVYGNYIVDGPSGMRVNGGQHIIFSNYIGNVAGKGLFLEGGEHDDMSGMNTDHKQVYKASVLFNTIVSANGIQVGGSHPMNPINCTVANNLLQGGAMLTDVGGTNITYANNFVNGGASVNKPAAVKMIDPKLTKVGEVFRIGAGSPAIDAADPMYPVMFDIDGNMRVGKLDVGANEITEGGMMRGPLLPKDVGPMSP